MLGLSIGSAIALGIGRLLGEQVVRRLVPAPLVARFDDRIANGGLWASFLIFLLPAFPDDAVCLLAGLTRFPLRKLLLVALLGRLPGMAVLSFVGASVGRDTGGLLPLVVGLALVCSVLAWLFSEELETRLARLRHRTTTP